MLVDRDTNDHVLRASEASADADAVAFLDRSVRLGAVAIDLHLAALARTFGFGARLEQTRDVEPDVETNAVWSPVVHVSMPSDQDFDLALCFESVHERVGLLLAIQPLEVLLDLRLDLFERDGRGRPSSRPP